MNVTFKDFSPNVPYKERYEEGVEYLVHYFDLSIEDAFYLIKQLKNNHSSVAIYTPVAIVDFFIFDDALDLQIDGISTWVASNIDLNTASEVLKLAYGGCEDFGSQIPGTNREWDVYFL